MEYSSASLLTYMAPFRMFVAHVTRPATADEVNFIDNISWSVIDVPSRLLIQPEIEQPPEAEDGFQLLQGFTLSTELLPCDNLSAKSKAIVRALVEKWPDVKWSAIATRSKLLYVYTNRAFTESERIDAILIGIGADLPF